MVAVPVLQALALGRLLFNSGLFCLLRVCTAAARWGGVIRLRDSATGGAGSRRQICASACRSLAETSKICETSTRGVLMFRWPASSGCSGLPPFFVFVACDVTWPLIGSSPLATLPPCCFPHFAKRWTAKRRAPQVRGGPQTPPFPQLYEVSFGLVHPDAPRCMEAEHPMRPDGRAIW